MVLEDLEKTSKKELTQKAKELFAEMKTCGHEQRPALLLEAQSYLQERDRRHDSWISLRDLLLELVVIALIGWEVHEGNKQYDLLKTMNSNAAATVAAMQKSVEAMGKLQQAQDDSLKTSNASLLANKQIADTLSNQLRILKVEQDARIEQQNRHPVFELTARTWEFGTGYHTVQVESGKDASATAALRVNRTQDNQVEVRFYLRNVGNAPAINVTATPRTATSVYIQCVDFPFLMLASNDFSYKPCDQPFAVIPPIYPRPKDRTEVTSDFVGSKFDTSYDVAIDVVVTVPPNINNFDLELVIRAEQFVPLQYRVQCHTAT